MGQTPVRTVNAQTNLKDLPLALCPDSIEGRLLGLSVADLLTLRFGEPVTVAVRGKRYRFEELHSDGSFKLRRAW